MMNTITVKFNTKRRTLLFENTTRYENVTTIKVENGYYEVFQELSDGRKAPLMRLPISQTVVIYDHE